MRRRLDGVLPTALEGREQRRETAKRLQEIDKLLRDDPDEARTALPVATAKSTRASSFGSGRTPTRSSIYWLSKPSSTPGPGSYTAYKADSLVKPSCGALEFRSDVCCRFQPCECKKKQRCVEEETALSDTEAIRQDTKQPRRSSPSLVAYPKPSDTEPGFQTREQRRRVTGVQAAKQRWKTLGSNTTPNYRWTERRAGAGGALAMDKRTSRDGAAAQVRLRKLLITDRKARRREVEAAWSGSTTSSVASVEAKAAADKKKVLGRDRVHPKSKTQRVVTAFGS